jgi:hypothetical protein
MKKIAVENLFKNYENYYIYSSIEYSEVVIVLEGINAGLRKLSNFF